MTNHQHYYQVPPQECRRCDVMFRTKPELDAHMRDAHMGAGSGSRAGTSGIKNGSLKDQLRQIKDEKEKLASELLDVRFQLDRMTHERDILRNQVSQIQAEVRADRRAEREAVAERRAQQERSRALSEAVASFTDEELADMGLSRQEAEARIPQVQTTVETEVVDAEQSDLDWYRQVERQVDAASVASDAWHRQAAQKILHGESTMDGLNPRMLVVDEAMEMRSQLRSRR